MLQSSENFLDVRERTVLFFRGLSLHVNEKKIDYIIFVLLEIVADTLPIYFRTLNRRARTSGARAHRYQTIPKNLFIYA